VRSGSSLGAALREILRGKLPVDELAQAVRTGSEHAHGV